VADAIKDCTRRGDIVLDTFSGSGTTIMAAERVGRHVRALEIEPRFVDVAIRRWQAFPKDFAASLMACTAALGPFQSIMLSFLSSSSSVAIKNFSSSSRIGFVRSLTSFKARSECERRGTANRRSLRSSHHVDER